MKILIAYFSKTGYTKEFAQAIENELSKKDLNGLISHILLHDILKL